MVDDEEGAEVMLRVEKYLNISKSDWLKKSNEEKMATLAKFTGRTVSHAQQTILIPSMTKSYTGRKIGIAPPIVDKYIMRKEIIKAEYMQKEKIIIAEIKTNIKDRLYEAKTGRFVKVLTDIEKKEIEKEYLKYLRRIKELEEKEEDNIT